ncbi:hypothetical protein H6G41_07955 [Tolypothrix sp. FACHB-123]|nr:hypothetical protein [Tolypothrix sp. FACHB-123]
MLTPVTDNYADLATALLTHYSFDLSGYTASELIRRWQTNYPIDWLHIAVIEALYQGRYKAVSVQQILNFWQRRGQATYHFNMEFQRLICSKFPESLTSVSTPVLYPAKKSLSPENNNYHLASASVSGLPSQLDREYSQRKLTSVKALQEAQQPVIKPDKQADVSYTPAPPVAAVQPSVQPESNNKSQRLLPASATHHPIGQFTPETSDRTESFTSKLKAMSTRPMVGRNYTREKIKDENSAVN